MQKYLEEKLWQIGKNNETLSREIWHQIIDALLDDFQNFI